MTVPLHRVRWLEGSVDLSVLRFQWNRPPTECSLYSKPIVTMFTLASQPSLLLSSDKKVDDDKNVLLCGFLFSGNVKSIWTQHRPIPCRSINWPIERGVHASSLARFLSHPTHSFAALLVEWGRLLLSFQTMSNAKSTRNIKISSNNGEEFLVSNSFLLFFP